MLKPLIHITLAFFAIFIIGTSAFADAHSNERKTESDIETLIKSYEGLTPSNGLRGRSTSTTQFLRSVFDDLSWYNKDSLRAKLERANPPPPNHDLYWSFLTLAESDRPPEQLKLLEAASLEGDWQRRHLAHSLLTSYHFPQAEVTEAISHVRSALNIIPTDDMSEEAYLARYLSWENLGSMYTIEYDLDMVLESSLQRLQFAEKANITPEPSEIFYNPLVLLAFHGQLDLAENVETAYFEAVENKSQEEKSFAYHARARRYFELKDHEKAAENFRKAIALHPSKELVASMESQLAVALAKAGRIDEAVEIVEAASEKLVIESIRTRQGKQVLIEKAVSEADYELAFNTLRDWSDEEIARIKRRVSSASRAAKFAMSLDSELSQARTSEEVAKLETARKNRELAEAKAERARVVSILLGVLAILSFGATVTIFRYLRTEQALRKTVETQSDEISVLAVKAQAAAIAKQQFLSMMSHEFRTPLNHILPVIDNVRQVAESSPKTRVYSSILDIAGKRILRIVDEINTLAGGEDAMRYQPEEFALEDLVDMLETERLKANVLKPELMLDVERGPQLPTFVAADVGKIHRVLLALVENAMKFGRGRPVKLRMDYAPSRETLILQVIDHGGGIDKATLETLKEPFTQADMSLTRPNDGLGIGLSLVSLLCRVMEAEFHLDGQYREGDRVGTCATVHIKAEATDGSGRWEPEKEAPARIAARRHLQSRAA